MIKKLIIFSGLQPSGCITLGNYIGAIKQWKKFNNNYIKYSNIYMIADLHCLYNFIPHSKKLKSNIYDTLSLLLACNINYKNSIIFLQSKVLEHCNLYWLLNSITYFKELLRMNQFKEKLFNVNIKSNIKLSLFNYPILMAADILLYKPNYIPVGKDQKQHLELFNLLIKRINNLYKTEIFNIPKTLILNNYSCKIMSLSNPLMKMSKSDTNVNSYISLLDNEKIINLKIKKAVTDSEKIIYFNKKIKPGISNLLIILSNITNISILDLELEFKYKNYNKLKSIIIKYLTKFLLNIQKKYYIIRNNKKKLNNILNLGNIKASKIANQNYVKLYKLLNLF